MSVAGGADLFDGRVARAATGKLRDFNLAGVLAAADVHVARTLGRLGGESDEDVLLAAALAVRAPRLGHVHVDLRRIRESAAVESDDALELGALPWPEAEEWMARVAACALVGDEDAVAPLRLEGSRLYLDRYWAEERQVAADLSALNQDASGTVDEARLSADLARLYGSDDHSQQRLAAATSVLRRLSVIAGGPGTGKTTTVARVLALLHGQARAAQRPAPLIALAAPTGKAAARLEQAVHEQARSLPIDEDTRQSLLELQGATLHRLLGRRPDSNSRFRHDRHRHLPFDVVVVDETSMVPLSLMARLIEALRPSARLVLVGDPGQLASIEAGAVLGDIVGPAADRAPSGTGAIRDAIVVLDRVYRFGGAIADLADAVRAGDADRAIAVLSAGGEQITWHASEGEPDAVPGLEPLRAHAGRAAAAVIASARAGDARGALDALGAFRLLCGHRRGPFGVSAWTAHIEAWLTAEMAGLDRAERWYAGRPVLVTENDYELGLYNGDTGVAVADPDGELSVAFERRGEIVSFSPTRLSAVETVFAMTIHKSQGSQFGVAAVVLPPPGSRLLTRELLYTAVTRAQRGLILAGSEEAVRAAVLRPVARASGLGERLWGAAR